jgi:hypothetical protein
VLGFIAGWLVGPYAAAGPLAENGRKNDAGISAQYRVNFRRSVPVQERQQIFETVPVRHRVLRYIAISLQLGVQRNDACATATRERNASNSIRRR